MKALFSWCVANAFLYYCVAFSSLVGFGVAAVVHSQDGIRKRTPQWLFLALAALTVLVWRCPTIIWPQPLNIDEGQWAACALKATHDFAPWRGFDGTTSGPLNSYVLALPALFGAPITFFTTRLTGYGLIMGAIYALYFMVKWTHGPGVARLSIVPPVAFLGLTWQWDFLHYSSEYLPIFLTTAGIAAGAFLATGERQRNSRLAACGIGGLFLGSAGFAKLQALPIALAGFVFILAAIYLNHQRPEPVKWMEALVAGIGFCAVPAAIAISVLSTGEWNDMMISYFKYAVFHVTSGTTVGFDYFFKTAVTYTAFAVSCLVVIAAGLIVSIGRWRFTKRAAILVLCALSFLGVCLVVIVVPRHAYSHYLLFSVIPLSYCVATVLGLTRDANLWQGRGRLLSAVVGAGFMIPAVSLSMAYPEPNVGGRVDIFLRGRPELQSLLPFQSTTAQVNAIKEYAAPGTRVAIWGWMPHYYVQTQTIPATRDAHTKPQVTSGPYQQYFIDRFEHDLRTEPPPVFVDAAAPGAFGINDRATLGFQLIPSLAGFIEDNYVLKQEVEGVRVFVLRDDRRAVAAAGIPK